MNIPSISKNSFHYYFILFIAISLVTFSSCKDKATEVEKADYATLMTGDYEGTLTVSPTISFNSKATLTKGSTDKEMIFTEKLKKKDNTDSTTTFKIELLDSNPTTGVELRIPAQTVQGVLIVGIALKEEDPKGTQGYFFYEDKNGKKLNQITFLVTANGGNYYYNYTKVE